MEDYLRRFLRSLIRVNDSDDLKDNIAKIEYIELATRLKTVHEAWANILMFIGDFHKEWNIYPHYRDVHATFTNHQELETLSELTVIAKQVLETGQSFLHLKSKVYEGCVGNQFSEVLKAAVGINRHKTKIGHIWYEGTNDALKFIIKSAEEIIPDFSDANEMIEAKDRIEDARERYRYAKENPNSSYGILSGFAPIDLAVKGIKRKEMMVIAASVGECKTTLSMNMAYNACVYGGYNICFATLEMSEQTIMDTIYCLHANTLATDPQYNKKLEELGVKPVEIGFDNIRSAQLTKSQERWYDFVLKDFKSGGQILGIVDPPYGNFYVLEPKNDISVKDLKLKLEQESWKNGKSFHLLVVDYPALMRSDQDIRMGETERINGIMKSLHKLAMTYNKQEGIAVICPFQINREGKRTIEGNSKHSKEPTDIYHLHKPVYSTYHLASASEAERSADYVIYAYYPRELRDQGVIHIGAIKNRHGEVFKPFIAKANLKGRHIFHEDVEVVRGKVEEIEL